MDGFDRVGRKKSLKERLGLKGMSCCGATLGFGPSTISVREDEDDEGPLQQIEVIDVGQSPPSNSPDPDCVGQIPAASTMNLAAALAAERQYRQAQDSDGGDGMSPNSIGPDSSGRNDVTAGTAPGTPLRVSLMRLLAESDGGETEIEEGARTKSSDQVCCVCMGKKKGAAFIPCGHTFCRVCSRELWLNRGSCPLCNRSILEILDIF